MFSGVQYVSRQPLRGKTHNVVALWECLCGVVKGPMRVLLEPRARSIAVALLAATGAAAASLPGVAPAAPPSASDAGAREEVAEAAPAAGQRGGPGPKSIASGDTDPLELARVVGALGDDEVLTSLRADAAAPERLRAIRATRWLSAPEDALGPLIDIMGGRDPALAPAAARALLSIVEAMTAHELTRREVLLETLAPHVVALEALAAHGYLRPDLRLTAAAAANMLAERSTGLSNVAKPQSSD